MHLKCVINCNPGAQCPFVISFVLMGHILHMWSSTNVHQLGRYAYLQYTQEWQCPSSYTCSAPCRCTYTCNYSVNRWFAKSVQFTCTITRWVNLKRTEHVYGGAVREFTSYSAFALCTVDCTYSGKCTCPVQCTLPVRCALLRRLTVYNTRVLCACECTYSVDCTCTVPLWWHLQRRLHMHWVHWQCNL